MSYRNRDPDDLTVSGVSQKKRLAQMMELQDAERVVKQKKMELNPDIAAVAIGVLALIALLAIAHFCPPAGALALYFVVGSLGLGSILSLYLKNREEEKLSVKLTENNMLELRDRAQGTKTLKKTEKAKETGKIDEREENDSLAGSIIQIQSPQIQFN